MSEPGLGSSARLFLLWGGGGGSPTFPKLVFLNITIYECYTDPLRLLSQGGSRLLLSSRPRNMPEQVAAPPTRVSPSSLVCFLATALKFYRFCPFYNTSADVKHGPQMQDPIERKMKSLGGWGLSGDQGTYASCLEIQLQGERTELKTCTCAEKVIPESAPPRQG